MATVTIDSPMLIAEPSPLGITVSCDDLIVGSRGTPAVWGTGHRDQLVIVEAVTERALGELRSAVIRKPSDVLNGIGDMEFEVPADDPTLLDCLVDGDTVDLGAGELMLIGREAQWWRDGELRWAGPVVVGAVDLGSMTVTFRAFSLAWYLGRRFMGTAERRDLLVDLGQMDVAGLPGWSSAGSVTAVRNTTTKVRGVGSAQCSGVGAIQASFVHDIETSSSDLTVYLTAMVRIPAGAVEGDEIITILAVPDGETTAYRSGEANTYRVQADTPTGQWIRVGAYTRVRPNVHNTITVTLWSQYVGNTYFDDVRAMKNDTTGLNPAKDLTTHAKALIDHAQSTKKGTFGFRCVVRSTTGVEEILGARHMEHAQLLDLFSTYTDRDDGWDWWIDPRNRTIYIANRRGVDHEHLSLDGWTAVAGGWDHDESEKSSDIVTISDIGDGIDRPEGGYSDRSKTGGLGLDWLDRAPTGTPLSFLDARARQIHALKSQPQTTFSPVLVPGDWWGEVGPGDRFPTHMRCGVLRPAVPDGGFRVQKVTYDLETDLLELV